MAEGSDGKRQLGRIQLQRRPRFSHEPGVRELRARGGVPSSLVAGIVEQGGIPCIDLRYVTIPLSVLAVLPVERARERQVLPLAMDAEQLYVAVADPTERFALDELGGTLGLGMCAYVALHGMLRDTIEAAYAARSAGASTYRGTLTAQPARELSLAWEEPPTSPRMLERAEEPAGLIDAAPAEHARPTVVPPPDYKRTRDEDSRVTANPPPDYGYLTEAPEAFDGAGELEPDVGGDSVERSAIDDDLALGEDVFEEELSRPLALLPSEPAALPESERASYGPLAQVRARVLVVDEREGQRSWLSELLGGFALEVDACASGLEALQTVRERAPDVVVIDGSLSDVYALEVCRRLKQSRRFGHIPIVLRSASTRGWRYAEDLREVFGIDEVLDDLAAPEAIVAAVERALAGTSGTAEPVRDSAAAAYLNAGIEAYAHGDVDEAIVQLRNGIEVDPLWPPLHYHLGLLYGKRKDLFEAIGALETAAELGPRDFSTLKNLAVLYQRAGFRLQATSMWQRALLSAPDDETRASIRNHLVSLL